MTEMDNLDEVDLQDPVERAMTADLLEEAGREAEAAILRDENAIPVLVDENYAWEVCRHLKDGEEATLIGTIRDVKLDAEMAYDEATGVWVGVDWDIDENMSEEERVRYFQECRLDAEKAERHASEAMTALSDDDVTQAAIEARYAARRESEYGDCPVWGPLSRLLLAAASIIDPNFRG
jgi:hypothetical protein